MSVGVHYAKADWNNLAYQLLQTYQQFCALSQSLAATVAPYSAATLATMTGFTTQEATDLISGINVADALRQLSVVNGTPPNLPKATAAWLAVWAWAVCGA